MLARTVALLLLSLALARAGDLHQAARQCDEDGMRELLARRPAVNEKDEDGRTPLHIAIDARQVECVRLLVEAGADRAGRDGRGRTPFDAAGEIPDGQERAAVRRSLVFGQETPQDPAGPPPWSLEYAVMRGQTGVSKMLLELGADPNATGTRGTTPLADAALKGNLDGVRQLLEAGARLDATSEAGTQPIHDAALGDSAEVLRELAARGADVNARTRDEARTPLHFAAAMGRLKAAEALVGLGADLAAKDSHGRTPLDAAERAGLTEVAALLRRAASGE